jgi:hypothetical protein
VIDATWNALSKHRGDQLKEVFANKGERTLFKAQADRLRDLRNYAIHDEDADEDEPLFRFNETGMLLLDAAKYFSQLVSLFDAVDRMAARA